MRSARDASKRAGRNGPEPLPSEEEIQGLNSALLSNYDRMDWLIDRRLLTSDIVAEYQIGWSAHDRVYTIPIRDLNGVLLNVRKYDPDPRDERRKIWGIAGHNDIVLWPPQMLEADEIFILEGEWDTLLLIRHGFAAVTRTGTAVYWRGSWSPLFKGKRVHVCQDCDVSGQQGALKVVRSVERYATVDNLVLPYPVTKSHGKDVTDFFEGHSRADFEALFVEHLPPPPLSLQANGHPDRLVRVVESLDSAHVGERVRIDLNIIHKRESGYSVPKTVSLRCDKSAGNKCNHCPLFQTTDGVDIYTVDAQDPTVLHFVNVPQEVVERRILERYGVPQARCPVVRLEVTEYQAVESMTGRQSLDGVGGLESNEYETARLYNIGRHDTKPNTTVTFTGALHPHPKTQENVLLTWASNVKETTIDRFDVTPEAIELMSVFHPRSGQRPLEKLNEITYDLSENITNIHGRHEMHSLMDLVWHSVISWDFAGRRVQKGWLEALIVGDTQQGKSEAARRLAHHYQAGEITNCEAATFAGVMGGLQRMAGGEWGLTWGVIPINSGRLVVLEEASGLTQEQISQLSEIRSSGIVKITKILTQETIAKTRLIWISNPRKKHMRDYTHGVQAIKPLIGNDEDIARFDVAMSVATGDVSVATLNEELNGAVGGISKYSSEACSILVRWAWTRKPEHVIWAAGAENEVLRQAVGLSERYIDSPPLVLPSNIRFKIARMAVALAARLFSSDETGEKLIVTGEHVRDAVEFMDILYGMKGFGYRELSKAALQDRGTAEENHEEIKMWLTHNDLTGLAEFMVYQPRFRRQDIEEVLGVDKTFANQVIHKLIDTKMARKEGANVVVQPTLNVVLRELARRRS
jgi:hypothetical protein